MSFEEIYEYCNYLKLKDEAVFKNMNNKDKKRNNNGFSREISFYSEIPSPDKFMELLKYNKEKRRNKI